jgi:glycosyltransferase involved in cell wall biosynthesis
MIDSKPHLVFYTNMPTPYQLDLFKYLKNHFKLTVVYFTIRENDRVWNLEDKGDGYAVIYLKNNLLARNIQRFYSSFHFSSEIKRISTTLKAEFAIVNGTYWSPNVQIAAKYSKKNNALTAFWGEPVFETKSTVARKAKTFFLNRLFRRVDLILAIGKNAEQSYKGYNFSKRIFNIPYSIDHIPFEKENLDSGEISELITRYKQNGELVILSSGSLIPRKGMDVVVSAFKQSSLYSNSRLLIIGEGTERDAILQMIGNDQRIQLLGFQDKLLVPCYFTISDIFIFASRYDGWGLVINEAMISSNAIICSTSVGAAADLLIDRENAILCRPDSVIEFRNALNELGQDSGLRETLASKAREKGRSISSEKISEKIYAIFTMGK